MKKKYGIKSVPLSKYDPNFISQLREHKTEWHYDARHERRIHTFLSFIAKIKYSELKCVSCIPRSTATDCYVYIELDGGVIRMLISTIRDTHQYPVSNRRIEKLAEELLYLDADNDVLEQLSLISHRPDMNDPQHQS